MVESARERRERETKREKGEERKWEEGGPKDIRDPHEKEEEI